MRFNTIFTGMLLAVALLILGCAKKAQPAGNNGQLVFYSWSEMFPQEVLDSFEKDTGIRINYINFDSNETMLTRLQAARGGGYDLIIGDDYIIETVIAEGLAQKLDKTKIPNYRNINPIYQKQFYDPQDMYTIPYGAGVQTIVYDPSQVNIPITGYADLWNPVLAGKVGIIESFRVINGMALKTLGQSYNTNDLSVIRKAGEKLQALAPNIRLIRDDHLEDELLSGEIAVAVMYTSQVTAALMENPNLKVVFPAEGVGFGIMGAFIPVNAPNSDAACAFLNFILDPERGARCFEALGYYSTFKESDRYIAGEYREFLTLPAGFNVTMEMIQNIDPEAEELHSLIWTEFKSAAGRGN